MLRVFASSVEPFLDGVSDLASGYEMRRAYDRYNLEGAWGEHDLSLLVEWSDWLYLCALKRYDDCLMNAKRYAEKRGLPELHEGFRDKWRLQNLLRDKDYAAIEAILEENRQNSLAELKKYKIFR